MDNLGNRRISLAEKLRKIPLSFFGKKDLADLTSTIMADCTFLEQSFSHFIPELVGSIVSTLLISVSLLFGDWRMALATLWVLPLSFAIVGFSAIDDALAAVCLAKATDKVDPNRVYIAGHSMGGYLIPRIDQADTDNRIAGYISLAGSVRSIMELTLIQIDYILSLHTFVEIPAMGTPNDYNTATHVDEKVAQDIRDFILE